MFEINNILEVEDYIDDVDAVLFDLDDTLYSEKEYVRSGYKKIADYFGISQMADDMWTVFKYGGNAIDEVLDKYQLNQKKDEALRIYRFQEPDIHLYRGVAELLDRIRESKKVGVITDGRPEGQRAKLKALRINVDRIIITDELGGIKFRKPNKTAFVYMKDFFNIEYDKMIYIGDNLKKDFIAPQELGMKSIWFRNADGLYV